MNSHRSESRADGPAVLCPSPHPVRTDYPDLSRPASAVKPLPRATFVLRISRPDVMEFGSNYVVQPIDLTGPREGRAWQLRLLQPGLQAGEPAEVVVCEFTDPDDGCSHPLYLGLSCTCDEYEAKPHKPCVHLQALAAVGLLRPAPTWSDWHDLDASMTLSCRGENHG